MGKCFKNYYKQAFIGVLNSWNQSSVTIDLPDNTNKTLYVIVENMGRLNFGNEMLDPKVI